MIEGAIKPVTCKGILMPHFSAGVFSPNSGSEGFCAADSTAYLRYWFIFSCRFLRLEKGKGMFLGRFLHAKEVREEERRRMCILGRFGE